MSSGSSGSRFTGIPIQYTLLLKQYMKTTTTRSVAYEHLLTSQPCNPTCEDVESHVRMRAGAKKDQGINTKLRGPTHGSLTDWSGKWTLLCRKSNEKCCQCHEALLRIFTQHHQPLSLGAKLSSGLDTSPALSYAVGVPTSSHFPCCCWTVFWFSWDDVGHESSLHFAWRLQACHSTVGCQYPALPALWHMLWESSHDICDPILEETGVCTWPPSQAWQGARKPMSWCPSSQHLGVFRPLSWSVLSETDHRSLGLARVALVPASRLTSFLAQGKHAQQ